ncbi:MAG: hypothetical protein QXM08_03515 [Thermofilaceae archaeon]
MMLITAKACADPSSTSRTTISLKPGVVTKIIVLIPYGHKALARLRFIRGATQIIPDVGWIQGDGETLEWSEMIDVPTDEAWTVEVVNEDTVYPHCFYIRIEIQPKAVAKPLDSLLSIFKKLLEAIGVE